MRRRRGCAGNSQAKRTGIRQNSEKPCSIDIIDRKTAPKRQSLSRENLSGHYEGRAEDCAPFFITYEIVTSRGDLFCLVAFFFQNGAFPFIFGEFPQRIAVLHLLMVSILKRVYIDLSISHKAIPAVVGENPPDCRDCFYLDYPKAFSVS